ncbi:MAG TPA: hypothetical protein VHS59_07125 [Bacillota bacterium]|nr:hypothetical protein [Bacillota bacterium]
MNTGLIEEILESIGLEKVSTDSNPAGKNRENRRDTEETRTGED